MKKIILCMLFMLVLSSSVLAYDPDPKEWIWRYSNDKQSVYTYNAPPELINISNDQNYFEFTGNVLSIFPYDHEIYQYQAKIRVGIKVNEKQMWIEYINEIAYDKNGNHIKKIPNPKNDNWHSVMHNTMEEGYGLALFGSLAEHLNAGSYNKEEPPKEATNKNI